MALSPVRPGTPAGAARPPGPGGAGAGPGRLVRLRLVRLLAGHDRHARSSGSTRPPTPPWPGIRCGAPASGPASARRSCPWCSRWSGSATGFIALQSLLAVAAWGVLAFTVGRLVPAGWRRVVAVWVVLAFASSTPIALWNRSVLSESLSLSLLALLVAAVIWTARRVTWPRVAAVVLRGAGLRRHPRRPGVDGGRSSGWPWPGPWPSTAGASAGSRAPPPSSPPVCSWPPA